MKFSVTWDAKQSNVHINSDSYIEVIFINSDFIQRADER